MRFNRKAQWHVAALLAVAAAGATSVRALVGEEPPTSLEARRDYIENLSSEEREELRRKKERFDALSREEQEQLRQLHQQISDRPDCDQIQHVMERYNQWLKTLTSTQRVELQSMPPDRRMTQIKRLMAAQEHNLLERLAKGEEIPPEDLKAILDWLAEFIEAHEEEVLPTMAEGYQQWYRSRLERHADGNDPHRRDWDMDRIRYYLYQRHLQHAFEPGGAGLEDEEIVLPSEAELDELKSRLSEKTAKLLDPSRPAQSLATAQKWIRAAMFSKTGPLISDEALRRFLERHVDPRKREELESLPPHRMREELVVLYMRQSREGWTHRGGPGGPPPNFRGGKPGAIGDPRHGRGGFRGPRDSRRGPRPPDARPGDQDADDNQPRD